MHQVCSSGSIHHQSVAAAALLTLPPAQVLWLLWELLCHLQASCLALEAARLLAIAFRLYELLSLSNNWARLHIYGCWKTQSQLEVLNAMSKKDFQLRGNGTVNTWMERGMGVRIWGLPRSWQVQLFCNWSSQVPLPLFPSSFLSGKLEQEDAVSGRIRDIFWNFIFFLHVDVLYYVHIMSTEFRVGCQMSWN